MGASLFVVLWCFMHIGVRLSRCFATGETDVSSHAIAPHNTPVMPQPNRSITD